VPGLAFGHENTMRRSGPFAVDGCTPQVIFVVLDFEGGCCVPGSFVDDGCGLGVVGLGVAAATVIDPPDMIRMASMPMGNGYRVRVCRDRRDAGGVVIL
jgi:hypothetical protein